MAVLRDRITVIPPDGETVTVDILASSVSLGTVYAERTKPRTLTLPLAISERTSFFVPAGGGPYSVSVLLGTTEIAGDGAPVTVSSFPAEIHATVDTAELGDLVGSGGSLPVGVPVIRAFPFAFDDAGLSDGLGLYIPAVGDVLLDAWIQVDDAWNGTTPLGDIGTFSDTYGWLAYLAGPCDMTRADAVNNLDALALKTQVLGATSGDLLLASIQGFGTPQYRRHIPAVFLTDDPVKVCVSVDGTTSGADPAATAGSGIVYLKTCTPLVGSTF